MPRSKKPLKIRGLALRQPWNAAALGTLAAFCAQCGPLPQGNESLGVATGVGFRNAPDKLTIGTCERLSVIFLDQNQSSPSTVAATTLSLSTSLGSFFADENCESSITSVQVPADKKSLFVYFQSPTPGVADLRVHETPDSGLNDATTSIDLESDAARLTFASALVDGLSQECIALEVKVVNASGADSQLGIDLPITFDSKYNQNLEKLGAFYTDASCETPSNVMTIPGNKTSGTISFQTNIPGEYKINAVFPSEAGLGPAGTLDLNARTELFGNWQSPCLERQAGSAERIRYELRFDDLDFVYSTYHYTGESGACVETELSHWTDFSGEYEINSTGTRNLGEGTTSLAASSLDTLDLVYSTSCVGVRTQAKANEYRSRETCGTRLWQESSTACNNTTYVRPNSSQGIKGNKNNQCEDGTWITPGDATFEVFSQNGTELRLGNIELHNTSNTRSASERPSSLTNTAYSKVE